MRFHICRIYKYPGAEKTVTEFVDCSFVLDEKTRDIIVMDASGEEILERYVNGRVVAISCDCIHLEGFREDGLERGGRPKLLFRSLILWK